MLFSADVACSAGAVDCHQCGCLVSCSLVHMVGCCPSPSGMKTDWIQLDSGKIIYVSVLIFEYEYKYRYTQIQI